MREERGKLLAGRNITYPIQLDPEQWHTFALETVGDTMRLSVDGEPAGILKSPGIAHATKSKVEFGGVGKDGLFDDLKIGNAEPVNDGGRALSIRGQTPNARSATSPPLEFGWAGRRRGVHE